MSKIIQVILGFFLFLTIVFTTISLTLLNERFVLMVIKKSQVTERIASREKQNLEEVKKHLINYVQSGYQEDELKTIKNESLGSREKLKYFKWINYICTLFFLILTGNILVKTKKKHNLSFLLFVSGLFLILFFGACTVFEKDGSLLFHTLYQVIIHLFLGIGILLIEVGTMKRRKAKKLS